METIGVAERPNVVANSVLGLRKDRTFCLTKGFCKYCCDGENVSTVNTYYFSRYFSLFYSIFVSFCFFVPFFKKKWDVSTFTVCAFLFEFLVLTFRFIFSFSSTLFTLVLVFASSCFSSSSSGFFVTQLKQTNNNWFSFFFCTLLWEQRQWETEKIRDSDNYELVKLDSWNTCIQLVVPPFLFIYTPRK